MTERRVVNIAFGLWVFALAAGIFETALAISQLPEGESYTVAVIARVAVTAVAMFFAINMRAGRNWARITLALGLGLLGTLSLVLEPLQWIFAGNDLPAAIDRASTATLVFAGSRTLHLLAVLTATVLMFVPAANAYFRPTLNRLSRAS